MDDLEREAARLCEPGTQMAVAARLSTCGVVRTGAVREAEVEIRVACHPRKTMQEFEGDEEQMRARGTRGALKARPS